VHDALGDPLVVEVKSLLAQRKVFEQHWPAGVCLQGVLVVGDGQTLVGRWYGMACPCCLIKFASSSRFASVVVVGDPMEWLLLAGFGHLAEPSNVVGSKPTRATD